MTRKGGTSAGATGATLQALEPPPTGLPSTLPTTVQPIPHLLVDPTLIPSVLLANALYRDHRPTCAMHPDLTARVRAAAAAANPSAAAQALAAGLVAALVGVLVAATNSEANAAVVIAPPIGAVRATASAGKAPPAVVLWLLLDPLDIDSKQTTFASGPDAARLVKLLYKWNPAV